MAFTQDFRTQRRNYADGQTRIGELGRLWYDSESNTIRVSDGETEGGIVVGGGEGGGSYTLPTASTTVKGGVKIDGQTIVIDNQQISVGLINYSSISNPPTLLSDFTNDVGFITSSALSSYATQTYVTTRGYITSYTETDPVFLAHPANNVTNTKISNWDTAYGWGNHASAGYLTSVGTVSYNDLSNKPTLFSGSYADLTNKPTIPTTTGELTNNSGYITASAIPAQFTFNVAADDSTQRTIGTQETIKFIGAGGITTSSDAEGNITITQSDAAAGTLTGSTLASGVTSSSLTSVGTLTGLTVSGSSANSITSSSGGTFLTLSSAARLGATETWKFVTNNNIGGPTSWIEFPDSTLQTTAWTGSVAYSSVTGTPTLATVATSGSYADLTNKPTLVTSYTQLTDKPIIPQAYTFNVAADDSTQRTVGTQETIKFIGAGGITTASDAEGNITITQGAGGAGVFSNQYSLTTTTSNATETELLVNGSTRIPVATNTSVNYIVNIAARRTDTPGDYAMFEIRGVAANSAGTVSDIGSVYEVVVARTNAGYLVDVRADDTNNSVNVYVTGVSGHTVDWKAIVQTIEV